MFAWARHQEADTEHQVSLSETLAYSLLTHRLVPSHPGVSRRVSARRVFRKTSASAYRSIGVLALRGPGLAVGEKQIEPTGPLTVASGLRRCLDGSAVCGGSC